MKGAFEMSNATTPLNTHQMTRKFLHDISTPLTIAVANAQRCYEELMQPSTSFSKEKAAERLEKAMRSIEKIESLVVEFKNEFKKSEP